VFQTFAPLGASHRSSLDWAGDVEARGGTLDLTGSGAIGPGGAVQLSAGKGGAFAIEQSLHDQADVQVSSSVLTLPGGAADFPSDAGSVIFSAVRAGDGGSFTVSQASDGVGDTVTLSAVDVLMPGGDSSIGTGDTSTTVDAGRGGTNALQHVPITSGTLTIGMSCNADARGGNASNTTATEFMSTAGGDGGNSVRDFAIAVYPASFSPCPATGFAGGTASGVAATLVQGQGGSCVVSPGR